MHQCSSRSGNEGLLAFDTGGDATSLLMSLNENAYFGTHHNKPRYENFWANSRIQKRCQRTNNNQMEFSRMDMEVCRFQCMGHLPTMLSRPGYSESLQDRIPGDASSMVQTPWFISLQNKQLASSFGFIKALCLQIPSVESYTSPIGLKTRSILADRPVASIAREFAETKSGFHQGQRTYDGKILNLNNKINQIKEEKNSLLLLPAVSSGRTEEQKMRYVWDGKALKAIQVKDAERLDSSLDQSERGPVQNKNSKTSISRNDKQKKSTINWNELSSRRSYPPSQLSFEHLRKIFSRYLEGVKAAFFPNPASVTPDYWSYAAWRGTHRLFSSISSVFATQSLLIAVGVGAKKSLPSAAAINWVLKDGLGRLGRLTVAAHFGESFDSDLKRFRFVSSLIYGGASAIDYLTPLAPQHFLPMAAIANIGKSIGLTTYISTQPAFLRSFAKSENLADIAAKSQAQQMAVDTIGLAIAVSMSALCRHSEISRRALPLVSFPFLISGDIFAIHKELNSIHLRTLNKERAELLLARWISQKTVLSPKEVSAEERMLLPPDASLGYLPLDIGSLQNVITSQKAVDEFLGMASQRRKGKSSKYVLGVDPIPMHNTRLSSSPISNKGSHSSSPLQESQADSEKYLELKNTMSTILKGFEVWRKGPHCQGRLHVALRSDASSTDVLEALMAAEFLRKRYYRELKNASEDNDSGIQRHEKWKVWREEAIVSSKREMPNFMKSLKEAGWQVEPFMLSSKEKQMYEALNV